MSVNGLKSCIRTNLSDVGFRRTSINLDVSPRDGFKQILLNGDGIDFNVISKTEFSISILNDDKYYRSIISDYKFYSQRVYRQRAALNNLLDGTDTPAAWILVTCYYLGFYSAMEILRLCGIYNIYLNDQDVNEISKNSETTEKLESNGTYTTNQVNMNKNSGEITMRFSKSGRKPHDIAWSSISSIVGNKSIIQQITDPDERKVTQVFKSIVDKSDDYLKTPNILRNEWNYTNADSYSLESDALAKEMNSILKSKNYKSARQWSLQKMKSITESSYCSGLAFVVSTLEATMYSVEDQFI